MGFIRGVFAGIAVAAGAAAWYMSRAGSRFRDRYRVESKLGELGDEVEARTRDVRANVNAHVAGARDMMMGGNGGELSTTLDDAQARAAEEAAEMAANVEAKAAKLKRSAKSAQADAEADDDDAAEDPDL